MITMRQLEALCAVIESGSISAAAVRLHLTQPAVSKIISSLEYRTQLNLFHREYRRIVPTAEAECLYREAKHLLVDLTDVARLAEELRTLSAGAISIGCMMALGSEVLPCTLARFVESRPKIDLTYQIRSPNKIMQWAIAQQIDFGIGITTMAHEAVRKEELCVVNGVCVMQAGHPLASRTEISVHDLEGESFIAFVKEGYMRQALDELFETMGVHPRQIASVSNSHAACVLAQRIQAVAVVDPYTALFFQSLGLVIRPFTPAVKYEFQFLWPRFKQPSKLVELLAHQIKCDLAMFNEANGLTGPRNQRES